MSFDVSFEEISLEETSSDSLKAEKTKETRKNDLALTLRSYKSNPETFEFENLLKKLKPKKVKKSLNDVVDRLMMSHQINLNKKRFLQQQKEYEEIKNCTFHPVIKTTAKTSSFQDFLKNQNDFLIKKQQTISTIRTKKLEQERETERQHCRTPRISPGSLAILNSRKVSRTTPTGVSRPGLPKPVLFNNVNKSHN